ncbi:SET and MYND domain-containing protein 4-like isoform X3 [Neodiprion virginianus]|uniref:SET and MYND domain-containing protein 4-like isoform X3 n=1 Tax=Neodiprion virginianus TaxID=2961670 RepID=UPI001EE75668|nr:SET and MYND domain-containing protein 4-like isoform X3 [Neodiprion virginianus]
MDQAKQLVLALKQNNKSHVGYGLQQESEALVSHILQNMVKSSLPRFKPKMKNSKDSMRYREEGNQRFVSGEDIEAIESYTKSLAYADSPELMAYAYANRSAALYRKQLYEECLIDINAALSLDYPASKKKKLQERGQNAMSAVMKRTSKSNGKLHDMNRIENNHSSDTESKEKCASDSSVENDVCEKFTLIPDMGFEMAALERSLTESNITCDVKNFSINSLDCKTSRDIEIPEYLANEGLPQLAYGPSKEAPSASDGVQITYSEKFGRHLIATKAFKPGDVIAAEKPFASVIYAERYYTHCNHCLSKCYNLIACPNCPMALYCSNHCQKLAWAAAHQIECRIISLLPNLLNVDEDKIRMLTKIMRLLIMVTQNGMLIDELRKDTEVAESNSELKDVSMYADIPFCGAIMLRACVIMSSNCFSIQQDPGIKSGSGLYVLHSLQNHSCAPNTFRHFEGLTMITRALEPIAVGEQIFTCYGTAHGCMPRNERKKKIMEEYFFECECPACYNDWPSYKEILENHIGSITKNKDLVQKLKPFKKKLLKNKYDIHAVKSIIEILHEETTKPCEEMIHAIQFLKSYYLGVDLTAA